MCRAASGVWDPGPVRTRWQGKPTAVGVLPGLRRREQGLPWPLGEPRQLCGLLPSFSIPTLRHFMKRQAWQDFRLRFVISHSLVAGQLYSMFPVTRHRQGCQVLSRAPTCQPRFPQGSGSQSRCSEVLGKMFPTLIWKPCSRVWASQEAQL